MRIVKTCTKCKIEKSKAEFSKRATKKDGLTSQCKSCVREYNKSNAEAISEHKREYAKTNAKKIADRDREYRHANAAKISAQGREYRQANSEKIAAWMRDHYKANADKFSEYWREYNKANPEKRASQGRNRRARVRRAEGAHSAADVIAILESQRGLCANCKTKILKSGKKKYHIDHIQPLSKGGSNDKYNLQCLCPRCNLHKSAKDPIKWANSIGKLV